MARLLTAKDLLNVDKTVKLLGFRVSDNYTGASHCSDYPRALVLARDEDHAIDLFCELAGIGAWHFSETSCSCCAPVDISIYRGGHFTVEELADELGDTPIVIAD